MRDLWRRLLCLLGQHEMAYSCRAVSYHEDGVRSFHYIFTCAHCGRKRVWRVLRDPRWALPCGAGTAGADTWNRQFAQARGFNARLKALEEAVEGLRGLRGAWLAMDEDQGVRETRTFQVGADQDRPCCRDGGCGAGGS